jgi:hypothetical protein
MRIEGYGFWGIVEGGTKPTDYNPLNAQLRNSNSNYNLDVLYKVFSYYKSKLKHSISEWEDQTGKSFGFWDDSSDDLMSHIIGLGQSAYFETINNPKVAWLRARSKYGSPEGFKESFAYVFN